jgi:hypothetical protein
MSKTYDNIEQCIICGSYSNSIISTKIREKNHNVLKCEGCGFVFLSNYEVLDYSNNYKSLVFSEGMSREEQIIVRSESLNRFNQIVSDLCLARTKNVKILEKGAGGGASIYGLRKLVPNLKIDCVELNDHDRDYINKAFDVCSYRSIDDLKKNYDIIFGHHVFEHFVDPVHMLNKLAAVSTANTQIYFSFPNFNDFYNATLNKKERRKYLEFNYHLAHPYYYTKETFYKLIERTCWAIESIDTIQDYSIVNYFIWYINGKRSKNIADGTIVNDNISGLNKSFIELVEKTGFGNNISVILKKR